MNYKHTQIGYPMIIAMLITSVFIFYVQIIAGPYLLSTIFLIVMAIVLGSFVSLTVEVDNDYINIKFGYGLIKKTFILNSIETVQSVRNPWYTGWGIRRGINPPSWIYNVSGYDAVQLNLKNGKVVIIGTDEPEKLEAIIKTFISQNR